MRVNNKSYKSIWIDDNEKIFIIDQTLLPFDFKIIELKSLEDVINAIGNMQVRGAPLIGVTAAFGIYLAMHQGNSNIDLDNAKKKLIATRPTAINLKWAINQIEAVLLNIDPNHRAAAALEIAKKMSLEDEKSNVKIGEFGYKLIENIYKKKKGTINILTHCNAGWLATVDWGTATAPIYKARDNKIPIHVWVDETRPRNQGSQLTAWELQHEGIDHTIIPDNTGGHLMQKGMVDIVIVGSDRTTFKGDVCNKIGTYLKALAAKDNNVPFYVALPSSTIDWETENSEKIIIEERSEDEIHYIRGKDLNENIVNVRITPDKSRGSNFAFDTTPSKYVSGLITENGICLASENDIRDKNAK